MLRVLQYPDLPEGAGISSSKAASGYPGKEKAETRRTGNTPAAAPRDV